MRTKTIFRDYAYLGTTQSVCPDCLQVVPAKIIERRGRVYLRKRCGVHGTRDDFLCSDVRRFDLMQYSLPGKIPPGLAIEPRLGCPFDCGLCTEHEQHTCIGVLEITENCNLECPLCYAASGPGGKHLSVNDCLRAMDSLIASEGGRAEVLQLSGGEPTVHPEFLQIFAAACERPIDIVMINTNGVRFAKDDQLLAAVAEQRQRTEVYLQFDGFDDQVHGTLRGEPLLDVKLRALERLGQAGLRVVLVCTVEADVNLNQLGRLVDFGIERPWVTGISFQPATYVGRYMLPESLEQRVTFPDVIDAIVSQSETWQASDFMPLPCAHPNAHWLAYAYRSNGDVLPVARFVDIDANLDLLANGITFNRSHAKTLIEQYLGRMTCGSDCGCGPQLLRIEAAGSPVSAAASEPASQHGVAKATEDRLAAEFFRRAIEQALSPADVFRITTTSFMDAYNFDVRQLMKSCVHHVLPSGHLIPFSAYNLFYRDGHVKLPELNRS
ncbi:MAG: radical SAM protein [Planctomycetales bacterium]|nr:radical SAM protein [Planctomycetales bacterium]